MNLKNIIILAQLTAKPMNELTKYTNKVGLKYLFNRIYSEKIRVIQAMGFKHLIVFVRVCLLD